MKLKEAEGKLTTAGTRTDREAIDAWGEPARNCEAQQSPRMRGVESGGPWGKNPFLLGEISRVRALEKSAEAIVATRLGERPRGAKGRRNQYGV